MSNLYELRGDVAVITLDNPPVNGLSHGLRSHIVSAVDAIAEDAAAKAIVLIGSPAAFSGGADIREFNTPQASAEPNLHTTNSAVEGSEKPVIAAISGACMGGGLELALSCHFRVALADASIALPEVKLGLLPGAGGTQRFPRAVGVETALNMIVSGNPVPAKKLAGTALFDQVVDGDLLEAALAFAKQAIADNLPKKRIRDIEIDYPNPDGYFQFARNTLAASVKNFPAPAKCVDAVAAAATKPFDEGIRIEADFFNYLVQTTESKALRHAFFGERAAARIPDVPADTPKRPIKKVGIVGAGLMGGGIAMNFLNIGIPVVQLEVTREALDKGIAQIRKNYESSLKKGRLTADQLEGRMGLLKPTLSYDDFKDVDLVIEAVYEDIGVKEKVFRKLDEVAKPGAILASNTSTLDVNRIAGFTKRPADVVGLHFFSPAHVMKLLEVVRGEKTAKDVLATVMGLAKQIKKTAVVSGVCDGFIGNRMLELYVRQAQYLIEEGCSAAQVDGALERWGMAMGPFRMTDMSGGDIGWAIRKRRLVERPDLKYARLPDILCELGRFGQKTNAGWYRYEPGSRKALHDPEVDKIVENYRKERGITPRKISDEEIVQRCILGLVNEGAHILEEGIAARASDIDMVYLTGYGFPAFRGGPMFYADTLGLYNVVRIMNRFKKQTGDEQWTPAPLLARLAAEGKSFN